MSWWTCSFPRAMFLYPEFDFKLDWLWFVSVAQQRSPPFQQSSKGNWNMATKLLLFLGVQSNTVCHYPHILLLNSLFPEMDLGRKIFAKSADLQTQSDEGFLFGGYTSKSWVGTNGFVEDDKAFIFTLSNPHNIPPTKFPVLIPSKAIYINKSFCLCFSAHDFGVFTNSNTNASFISFPNAFKDTTNKGKLIFTNSADFKTKEIEVYSVTPM